MMKVISKIIKKEYKYIILFFLFLLIFSIKFPYYIDAPGGINNVSNKIEIEGYESVGTFNLAYVKEYEATIPTLVLSLFNSEWRVLKKNEVVMKNENVAEYNLRDKIFIKEAVSNAIFVAYNYSKSHINIISSELLITYVFPFAQTNLNVGDKILKINDKSIESKEEISTIISDLEIGDKIKIICEKDGLVKEKYAYIINDNDSKKIGISISKIMNYDTNPKINIDIDKNESGSSGGLIMALSIYNSLTSYDITKGLKIVGTGTIDLDGNIGSIGGVEYKLKSAVKAKADLFIVPKTENYEEALKLKKKNNYSIEIVGVSTFDEVINYLKNKNGTKDN